MRSVVLGAAALNQTPLDWTGNMRRIRRALELARKANVGILCLPELCLPGYGCEDAFFSPALRTRCLDLLEELRPDTKGLAVAVGAPLFLGKKLYNTSCLIADGEILGFVAKHVLAGSGVYYEPRWFSPWPLGESVEIELSGRKVPAGDLVFDLGGVRLGFEICEDAWVDDRRANCLAKSGVKVVLNPSASHFSFGKFDVRKDLVRTGSKICSAGGAAAYVYCNHLGNDEGRLIYDGGSLIAVNGEVVSEGPRLSFEECLLTTASVAIAEEKPQAASSGAKKLPRMIAAAWTPPPGAKASSLNSEPASWERGEFLKEEEFARAVALGLFDYIRKSRSRGVVISLSGGADSSATACLAALAVDLAAAEIGLEGIRDRLAYWPAAKSAGSAAELRRELITCVYQGTANSSETTRNAAATLAEALNATFFEFRIQEIVDHYVNLIGAPAAGGRPLRWETDDLTLQNIQARSRGPGVWLVANLKEALLLATSNRSEAAVGYTTMDGDTCGGLSPIGGIDKAFLRRWLRWLEATGVDGKWCIPALRLVNAQEPTAELRPAAAYQTDEGDLMPYAVLDRIERAAVRDRLSPWETFQRMEKELQDQPRDVLLGWVERFFRLWARSQWKRERYAPTFHLDDENLDPKTWCRFPILSGGFEEEIAEMRRLALRPAHPRLESIADRRLSTNPERDLPRRPTSAEKQSKD